MDNEKNELKIFKLNRFFNIFNPNVYSYAIVIASISLIYFIISIINREMFEDFSFRPFIAGIIFLITVEAAHRPGKISIYNGFMDFDDYTLLRYGSGKGFWWVKIRYSVSDIYDMEFHQNFIEKMFDVGHIYFKGKAMFTASRDVDRIKEKDNFTIYGVKNFEEFKRCFEKIK